MDGNVIDLEKPKSEPLATLADGTTLNTYGQEIVAQTGQFVKGHKGGPGRKPGSRNKVAEAFLRDLHEAWEKPAENGKTQGLATIEAAMKEKPADVVKAMVALMPKEMKLSFETMSDGELSSRISQLAGDIGIKIVDVTPTETAKNSQEDPL